jgi:hypothetical protein
MKMKKAIFVLMLGVLGGVAQASLVVTDDFNRPDTLTGSFASNITQVAATIGADWKPVTQANGIYTTQYKITNNALGFAAMATNVQKALLVNTTALTANSGVSNFTLSATLKDTAVGTATYGVIFNYKDDGSYYQFRLTANGGVQMLCYSNYIQQSTPITAPNGTVAYVKGNEYTFTVQSSDPYAFDLSIIDATSSTTVYTRNITLGSTVVKLQDGLGGVFSTGNTVTVDDFRLEAGPEPATIGMLGLGALFTVLIRRGRHH